MIHCSTRARVVITLRDMNALLRAARKTIVVSPRFFRATQQEKLFLLDHDVDNFFLNAKLRR